MLVASTNALIHFTLFFGLKRDYWLLYIVWCNLWHHPNTFLGDDWLHLQEGFCLCRNDQNNEVIWIYESLMYESRAQTVNLTEFTKTLFFLIVVVSPWWKQFHDDGHPQRNINFHWGSLHWFKLFTVFRRMHFAGVDTACILSALTACICKSRHPSMFICRHTNTHGSMQQSKQQLARAFVAFFLVSSASPSLSVLLS